MDISTHKAIESVRASSFEQLECGPEAFVAAKLYIGDGDITLFINHPAMAFDTVAHLRTLADHVEAEAEKLWPKAVKVEVIQ